MAKKTLRAKEFSGELDNWIEVTVPKAVTRVHRAIVLDFFRTLVKATPVGNADLWATLYPPANYVGGTARSSWFISKGKPGTRVPSGKKDPESLAGILGRGEGNVLSKITKLSSATIWIYNNLPYIDRIMEKGWSTQAPSGTFSKIFVRIRSKWSLK